MLNIPMNIRQAIGVNGLNNDVYSRGNKTQSIINSLLGNGQSVGVGRIVNSQQVEQFGNNQTFGNNQPFGNNQSNIRKRSFGNGVVLKKGQKASLTQLCPGLDLINVGLGWDLGPDGRGYDLDVEAFMLGMNGVVLGDDWFVFYGQTESPDGAVRLLCDSTTGVGDGDDEIIQVQLSKLNNNVNRIVFIVSINEAKENGYNFSNVSNAYVRITDIKTNKEIAGFS